MAGRPFMPANLAVAQRIEQPRPQVVGQGTPPLRWTMLASVEVQGSL